MEVKVLTKTFTEVNVKVQCENFTQVKEKCWKNILKCPLKYNSIYTYFEGCNLEVTALSHSLTEPNTLILAIVFSSLTRHQMDPKSEER